MPSSQRDFAFPRDFLCEHTAAKSRVFVLLVPPHGLRSLRAVLTCSDPAAAQRAADVLSAIALNGSGKGLDAAAERVISLLPAAPAASFRESLDRARAGRWPLADCLGGPASNLDGALLDDEEARTPHGARLRELSGTVVRVIEFSDYHVHDVERLLASAAAHGWAPEPADPAERVLDAVMWLAPDSAVPGADVIDRESAGQVLRVAAGDETVGWQEGPLTAKFLSGWRLKKLDEDEDELDFGPRPDFASLFQVQECECEREDCDKCVQWFLTPRTADLLHTALEVMADQAYDEVEEHGDAPVSAESGEWAVFGRLPRITRNRDAAWRRQIARACDDLVSDLASGHWPVPRNNAEEIVLHLAIEDAPTWLEDCEDPVHEALPAHRDDYDWDACSEDLFLDHDVLMLYDDQLDGIEDPGNEANRYMSIGDLRPESWFDWFANVEPRDPERAFRR
jgi:hypothetical protein